MDRGAQGCAIGRRASHARGGGTWGGGGQAEFGVVRVELWGGPLRAGGRGGRVRRREEGRGGGAGARGVGADGPRGEEDGPEAGEGVVWGAVDAREGEGVGRATAERKEGEQGADECQDERPDAAKERHLTQGKKGRNSARQTRTADISRPCG